MEITHRNGYPEFTALGKTGQSVDRIKPKTEDQQKLVDIWNKWHLNGMNAGTDKQQEILKGTDSTDYSERKAYLDSFTIDGEIISHLDYTKLVLKRKKLSDKFKLAKKQIDEIDLFRAAFKKAPINQQFKIDSPVLKIIADGGEFKSDRIWKNYTNRNGVIPARYNNRLKAYEKECEEEYNATLKLLNESRLSTAKFDIHPETKQVYEFGTGWIKRSLPENFWEELDELCLAIEEYEAEEKSQFSMVVDINTLDEEEDLYKEIYENMIDDGAGALALHLGLNVEELGEIEEVEHCYGNCCYEAQGEEYYCGNAEDILEAVKENIEQSLWAFNSSFLASETGLPEAVFSAMQGNCEDSNEGVLACIEKTCGLDSFVDSAISADGVGHFLNNYDGTSSTVKWAGETFTICRT